MEGYQKYRTYVRFLPCHLLWMKQSSSISFMSSDGVCALAKSSASEHTQSASETCATPQWLFLSVPGIVFRTFRENKVLCKGDGRVSKVPHIRAFPTLPSPLDETIFIHIFHVIRRRMCARKIFCKRTYPVGERDMCHSTVASSVSQCLRYHLLDAPSHGSVLVAAVLGRLQARHCHVRASGRTHAVPIFYAACFDVQL